MYLPAITAILVVLLEGAVSDLPWGMGLNSPLHAELALSPSEVPEPGQNADSGMTEAEQPQSAAGEAGEAPFGSAGEQDDDDRAESEGGRESAAAAAGTASTAEAAAAPGRPQGAAPRSDGGREVRSGVLRLLASVWSRFPAQHHDSPVFARFFAAVAPLMSRLTTEVRRGHMASHGICLRLLCSVPLAPGALAWDGMILGCLPGQLLSTVTVQSQVQCMMLKGVSIKSARAGPLGDSSPEKAA